MKQLAKRTLALVCVIVLATAAYIPYVAYADEPEAYEAIEVDTQSRTVVTIEEETYFSFTPNATGYWTFVTSNNIGNNDPQLRVQNHYGHVIASDSGTAPNNNAIVKVHLVEGAHYIIWAGSRWGTVGSFTLTVYMSETFTRPMRPVPIPIEIPGEGGISRGRDSLLYTFSPHESGFWNIQVEADDYAFFEIEISDSHGNYIAGTLDHGADNFFASMRLVAGETYLFRGRHFGGTRYSFTISPADSFEPWIDWDMLAGWDIEIDLDAEMPTISPYRERIAVNASPTQLSFTPYTTGPWLLEFTDNNDSSLLLITDTYGSFLLIEEIWWDEQEILFHMEADVEYIFWISAFWGGRVNFNMYVSHYEPQLIDDDIDYDEEPVQDIVVTDWGTRIPSEGGYVPAGEERHFHFTPATTGSWTVQLITEIGWSELSVSDFSRSFTIHDWDNGIISLDMAQHSEYTIDTWVGWDDEGALVFVSPTYMITFPGSSASTTRRIANETEFTFVPGDSGYWVIYTTHNVGQTDPFLWLVDAEGNIVAYDDDGGEGLNSMIKIHLEAGDLYTIRAGFFIGSGEYRLNVRLIGGGQERDLVVLLPPV